MLKLIRVGSKEKCEEEILCMKEWCEATVIINPHTWDDKEWFATVEISK